MIAIIICKTNINEKYKITKKSCVKHTDTPLEYSNIEGQLINYRNIYIYIYKYAPHNDVSVNDGQHI